MRFHRARILIISAILTAATFLATVATALAGDIGGPVPK
jgi:hypothetical protein